MVSFRAGMAACFAFSLAAPLRAQEARALVATLQHRVETEDSRGSGHLVRVDANGHRSSSAFSIRAHWFPGVLRVLLEVAPSPSPAGDQGENPEQEASRGTRERILLEMRPDGQSTIHVLMPNAVTPMSLPAEKWGDGMLGSDFSYEDFLSSEAYWQNQTLMKSAKLGSHDCDVLRSVPRAAEHSHYSEVQTWLDHATSYPLYVQKTVKGSATVKQFTSLGLRQVDGVWSARQIEVKVQGRPGSTLLVFDRGSTKANLSAKDFSLEPVRHAKGQR